MRPRLIAGLSTVVFVTASALYAQQTQTPPTDPLDVRPPIYRAGTYLIPVGLVLNYRKQPWVGLTKSDVLILFDKASIVPAEVQPDRDTPNRYTVFFQPPDNARDDRAHTLQIRLKKPNSKDWTTLPFKKSITLKRQ